MTARQLLEWQTFAALEPFGEDREDARFGAVVQVVANANRNPKRKPRPFTLEDCTLSGGDALGASRRRRQTPQEMKAVARMWADAGGA
jgi:hypothetical protein